MATAAPTPKHRQVYAAVRRDIESGRLSDGARLPSEAVLGQKFGASRITVSRAMRDLQVAGLIERRAGSGTFVKAVKAATGLSFGLLIPDLGETEIFEPICQGMMGSPLARQHALVWGSPNGGGSSKEERAWQMCRQYIDRRVSGVFFAPLEEALHQDDVNLRIVEALDAARIPVVLLDRPALPYPRRGHHDLVGIDNRRAGYIDHGAPHVARQPAVSHSSPFLRRPPLLMRAKPAIGRRSTRRTFRSRGSSPCGSIRPTPLPWMKFMRTARPDAVVCANDRTAARLMPTLLRLGYAIPGNVRLVGIDDVEYAGLLPVPLTTLRQPTQQIGDVALGVMLERVARTDFPPRDVQLHCELVVRESCGSS